MSWQKHIIKKQVVELQLPADADSREIQARTSRIVRDHLLPLIDEALGRASPPGTVWKIQRLELDLGAVSLSRLEEQLAERTAAELEKKLHQALGKNESAPPAKSSREEREGGPALDVITYFLQTGLFPWWAKEEPLRAFERALNEQLSHNASRLKHRLYSLLQNEAALKRLVCSCSDAMLYRIVQCWVSQPGAAIRELQAGYTQQAGGKAGARLSWWQTVFAAALCEQEGSAGGFAERTAWLLSGGKEGALAVPAVALPGAESLEFAEGTTAVSSASGEAKDTAVIFTDPAVSAAARQLISTVEKICLQLAAGLSGAPLPDGDIKELPALIEAMQTMLYEAAPGNALTATRSKQELEKLEGYAKGLASSLTGLAGEHTGAQLSGLQGELSKVLAWIRKHITQLPAAESRSGYDRVANSLERVKESFGKLVSTLEAGSSHAQLPAEDEEPSKSFLHAAPGTGEFGDTAMQAIENCLEQLSHLRSAYRKTFVREAISNATDYMTIDQLEEQLHEMKHLLTKVPVADGEQQAHHAKLGNIKAVIKAALAKLPGDDRESPGQAAGTAEPVPVHRKQPKLPAAKLYDPFSESEKIRIGNAGLVLLWPFLHRFFRSLALAGEKAFADESAAEKACLLLQHITGTLPEDLFEAQLPLNKILCGIGIGQPIDTQQVIEPDEAEAAEHFLQAVIQNGPLWKTLSIPGFRQAYLNREGLLSTRDGNWLLQAKRESYDVIVDRLPWPIRLVKLPWMERLIFVEW